jgi:hypothetical protein
MTHDISYFRPSRLWRRLTPERRLTAAELFWLDEDSADIQAEAIAAISAHMKFRTKSVLGLSAEKRTKYLATLPTISDSIASRALVSYHLERQRPMMGAFLDLLGITHDNGLISDTEVQKPDESKLRAAARELASRYPAEDVSLYFATLVSQDPDTWGQLADVPEMAVSVS